LHHQIAMHRVSVRTALLLILLVSPAAVGTADACMCPLNPACSAAWMADAVFVATAADMVEERVGGHLYWHVQRLVVRRTLRGTVGTSATMVPLDRPDQEQIALSLSHDKVHAGSNSCAYGFRAGDDYLVYATRTADGRWTTSKCSGTKPLGEAQADLDYFASLPTAEPTGRVYGSIQRTILDADDPTKFRSVPASGIAVALSSASSRATATTDEQGKLDVRLPPGEYSVAPVVPETIRFYGGPNRITLAARGCAPVGFSLISNGRVEGQVVGKDGSAVPRVTVGVIPTTLPAGKLPVNSTTAPIATTDEVGRFRIDAILPGTYLLAVNPRFGPDLRSPYAMTYFPAGERGDAVPIEIGDGERKTGYTITVTPLAETSVGGRVVFEDGQPVAGASVYVYAADSPGHLLSWTKADSDGAFRLRALAGVTYLIQAGIGTGTAHRQTETRLFVEKQVDDLRITIR
jgi:Carboxypeptidase regulatory-like domain